MLKSDNPVDQATGMIKSLPDFFDAISGILQTPLGWLILVAIVFGILINRDFNKLFSFFTRREKLKLERLKEYTTSKNSLDTQTHKAIEDIIDACYFKIATGIYAEKKRRNSLITLHKKISHTINWSQIKRALPFIKIESDSKTIIRDMTTEEKIGYFYNLFTGIIMLIFSSALFLLFIFSQPKDIENFLLKLTGSIIAFSFTFFIFYQNLHYDSARKIKKEISKKYRINNQEVNHKN